MTAPLYTGHGRTIPDPADSWLTDSEINAEIDAVAAIPPAERVAFYNAVRVHHDHQHFEVDVDNIYITLGVGNSIKIATIPFDYGGATGHEGLDMPG